MDKISDTEIERQYRVLRQTLEMHAILRDEYSLKVKISQVVILFCSVIFCATTFASDQLFIIFKLPPELSRTLLGIASILAFAFSLVLMIFDWSGKSAQHREAVDRWSALLEKFRRYRGKDGSWSGPVLDRLSAAYWEADRNSVKIPNKRFNSLKSRYLRKVAISKLKSSYPACPNIILFFILFFKDSYNAIMTGLKSNSKTNES